MNDAPKSGGPPSDSLLEGLTFCLDETNDGARLIDFLRSRGAVVERLKDHHVHCGTTDEEWLPYVCEKCWIILSRDNHIRRRLMELLGIKNTNGRMFVLRSHALSSEAIVEVVGRSLVGMVRFINETDPPFIANIVRSGEITQVRLPDWEAPEQ